MVLAEDLRQAVLQAALQGKLTEQLETDSDVDEMLINIQVEKKKLIAEKKIKKEKPLPEIQEKDIPFDIPDNWKFIHLGEIALYLDAGKSPDCIKESVIGEEWGVITTTAIQANNFCENENKRLPNDFVINRGIKIEPNDILITRAGPMTRTGIMCLVENIRFNLLLSDKTVRVNIDNKNVSKKFIVNAINSPCIRLQIINMMSGMDKQQVNISQEKIRKIIIPLPPIEEQQRIVDKINEIMPKIDEYEKIEKELEALKKEFPTNMKDALLQAAMQGKLTEQLESDGSVEELATKENINLLDEEDYPYFIPDNWKFAELGELTSIPIKRGKAPKYVDKSGILVFAQKCNQKVGKVSLDDAKYLDENIKHKYEQDNYLQGNDIVINSTGGGTLGRIGYISEELFKHSLPIVPDSHIPTVRTKNNVSSKYIYFFLKFNQSYLETMGVGSTNQTELRPDTIKELLVPIPPIEEQQRIVERLEALLPLCEELKE